MRRVLLICALLVGCDDGADEPPPPPPVPAAPTPTEPAPTPPVAPTPTQPTIAAGATGMATFRDQPYLYAAVVTDVRADGQYEVVFADGDTQVLAPTAFKPDRLGVGSTVEARIRTWPRFFPGRITRRIGHAVYVEFDDGDAQWTSIGLVRMPVSAVGPNATAIDVEAPTARAGAPGSTVVANFRGEGRWYAGVVAERRSEDGKLHVIYADGDSEWVEPSMVRPDAMRAETTVDVAIRREGENRVLRGTILRRVGHAVEVRRADGTTGWSALANTRLAGAPE